MRTEQIMQIIQRVSLAIAGVLIVTTMFFA